MRGRIAHPLMDEVFCRKRNLAKFATGVIFARRAH
jgi:hypothetical protein